MHSSGVKVPLTLLNTSPLLWLHLPLNLAVNQGPARAGESIELETAGFVRSFPVKQGARRAAGGGCLLSLPPAARLLTQSPSLL